MSRNICELRSWMYAHKDSSGRVTEEFLKGAEMFMYHVGQTSLTLETGKMFCPCRKCNNTKFVASETVWKHIVNRGFTPHYYIQLSTVEQDKIFEQVKILIS